MKKLVLLSIFTLAVTLGIVNNNNIKVQAAVSIESMDFDQNNAIDVLDLASLADRCNLQKNNSNAKYDLNGDNAIDLYDLVEVSSVLGTKINRVPDNTNITSKFTDSGFRNSIYKMLKRSTLKPILYSDVKNITTLNLQNKGIFNLSGIEYFTSLTTLHVTNNLLTKLDLSSNIELTELSCNNNPIIKIDLNNNPRLTNLVCNNNMLNNIDISKNPRLSTLDCSNNLLTSLDVSKNARLTSLSCDNNKVASLDINNNKMITNLSCNNNKLTNLNVSANTSLTNLNCNGNQLTNLDVDNNGELSSLSCSQNRLKTLDISKNVKLANLSCILNEITKLYSIKDTWNVNSYQNFQYLDTYHLILTNNLKITVRVYE